MHAELLILRFVHVVGAVFWVGQGMFMTLFFIPALAPLGPTAGTVMGALQQKKFFFWVPVVAMLTMLSGLRLLMIASAGNAAYFASTPGRVYSAAALTSVIGFLLSTFVSKPLGQKGAELAGRLAGEADPAARERLARELGAVRGQSARLAVVGLVLMFFTAGGMAVARYL